MLSVGKNIKLKELFIIISIFIIVGCKNEKAQIPNKYSSFSSEAIKYSISFSINTKLGNEYGVVIDTTRLPQIYTNESIDILLPGMYRNEEPGDYKYLLSETWYGIYFDTISQNDFLEEVIFDIAKKPDDCLGIGILSTFVLSFNEKPFDLFIKGLSPKNLELKTLKHTQLTVPTNTSYSFDWNNEQYTLRATGVARTNSQTWVEKDNMGRDLILEDSPANYKLYLSTSEQEQLLIAIPELNNTNVQIIFIGDVDEDGLPDFIFDASADYEGKVTLLFLSSKAKEREIVRCVGESSYAFDC